MFRYLPLFSIVLFFACSQQHGSEQAGHDLMIAKLDSINQVAKDNPLQYFYANEYRLTFLDSLVAANPNDPRLQYHYGLELQNSLKLDQSIPVLEELKGMMMNQNSKRMVYEALAMSYLRLAEVNNCIENYTPSNCILPFDEDAIHTNKSYVQSSIEHLEVLLEDFPDNYAYYWMYNIAHIANGSYPDEVGRQFLIPNLQESEELPDDLSPPVFTDRGMMSGVGDNRISGSSCVDDFNGNGHLDIFATSYGFGDEVILYHSDGNGAFTDQTQSAKLGGVMGGLNIECADINNSGHTDILILRGAWLGEHGGHPNSLLRNNGDGTFTDITISSGLYERSPTQVAAFADLNHNGYLDIFIGNESASGWQNIFSGGSGQSDPYPSAIFINNGDETFTRHITLNGFELDAFVKGATWGDVSGDGFPDLYVSVMGAENKLFIHQGLDDDGAPIFQESAGAAGVSEPVFSFPTWFFDYNNNGLDDLFVVSYDVRTINNVADNVTREKLGIDTQIEYPRLFRNNGDGTFKDVTEEAGLQTVVFGMGANFADLNNNGYPDIYIGTGAPDLNAIIPNRLFLNKNGDKFYESTAKSGVGHLQKGHGVSMADFNNNGLMDIYTVLGGAVEGDFYHNALFENRSEETNWIVLELEGSSANRQAIGARVKAIISDGDKTKSLYRTVSTGGSFGANNRRVHFGLGAFSHVQEIQISWPGTSELQILSKPDINQLLYIQQDVE